MGSKENRVNPETMLQKARGASLESQVLMDCLETLASLA